MLNGVQQVSAHTYAWRVVGSRRRLLVQHFFLRLIVRSKAFAASAKWLTTACRAISLYARRAQSSAKSSTRITSSRVLVWAMSLWRLKTLPSFASLSIILKTIAKSVGGRLHPCLTPLYENNKQINVDKKK